MTQWWQPRICLWLYHLVSSCPVLITQQDNCVTKKTLVKGINFKLSPWKWAEIAPQRKWISDSNHWSATKMFVSGRVGHNFFGGKRSKSRSSNPAPFTTTTCGVHPPKKKGSKKKKTTNQVLRKSFSHKKTQHKDLANFMHPNGVFDAFQWAIWVVRIYTLDHIGISEWFIIVSYFSSTPWKST